MTTNRSKTKSFNDYSRQMERIYILNFHGYGSKRMMEFCEEIFEEKLIQYGY